MKNKSDRYIPKDSSLGNPHDAFVKKILGQKRHAMDFFEGSLPAKALTLLDLNTLKAEKDSFISSTLRSAFSDLIFSVEFKEQPENKEQPEKAFLYILLEHKSHPDRWCTLQILKYMSLTWEKYHQDSPNQLLPPILPIVLYHGDKEWKKKDILELLDGGQPDFFRSFTPAFETILCNVRNLSPISQSNIELHIFLKALADATESEIRKKVAEYLEMVSKSNESKEAKLAFLELLFRYLNAISPDIDGDFLEMVLETTDRQENTNYKEGLMSLFAEKFEKKAQQKARQEVWQEARQEARRKDYETMRRLHTQKIPLKTIALAVNLPKTSVKTILRDGFKAMEHMYLEENTQDED